MTNFRLDDRTIVITGISRGLGAAIAQAVLEAGADVFGIDILPALNETEWPDAEALQKRTNTRLTLVQADVRDESAIESAMNQVKDLAKQRSKPVKGLVNSAGVQNPVNAEDYTVEEFQRIIDINLLGSFIVSKHVARLLIAEKQPGSLVLIGSIAGYVANRVGVVVYMPP